MGNDLLGQELGRELYIFATTSKMGGRPSEILEENQFINLYIDYLYRGIDTNEVFCFLFPSNKKPFCLKSRPHVPISDHKIQGDRYLEPQERCGTRGEKVERGS